MKLSRNVLRIAVGATVAIPMMVFSAGAARADSTVVPLCPTGEGPALSGTYKNLTITGNAHVNSGATLKVKGNLRLAPNSCLDAFSMGTVTVTGDVTVDQGATLALGCSLGAIEPGSPTPCTGSTADKVGGDLIATDPWTMYLTADRIGGDVVSNGGGPGVTYTPYVNFPIKENTIGGDLVVTGWKGAWFGALRNKVTGDVIISGNITANPDSTEIYTNTVRGNLVCTGNSPAAQAGDAVEAPGAHPNVVHGAKVGECTAV